MNPLDQLIMEYIQYTSGIVQNPNLGDNVKPQMLLQMAQALNVLVPLTQNDQQAELEMKSQEHQMTLQAKQAELEFKAQEHGLKLRQAQETHQMKLSQQKPNVSGQSNQNS